MTETEDKKFTMYDAQAIDLHTSGASYEVGEEGITELWIAELADGRVAIMTLQEDGTRTRIGYRGDYTIWWTTEEAAHEVGD